MLRRTQQTKIRLTSRRSLYYVVLLVLLTLNYTSAFNTRQNLVISKTNQKLLGKSSFTKQEQRSRMSNLAATVAGTVVEQHHGQIPKLKVCVIGAGAAGLVTARIFQKNGIMPTIMEKDSEEGGVWSYHAKSTTRPMYRGLRTNLPREVMQYREYPWGGDGRTMSFVTHYEVKDYLRRYAKSFNILRPSTDGNKMINFQSKVTQLKVISPTPSDREEETEERWPQIQLEWESINDDDTDTTEGDEKSPTDKLSLHSDTFDAVCICNGHYSAPSNPTIDGIETNFKGKIYHSIEYDDPTIFENKVVLCIGGRASGADLAREISRHAKKVYLSDTTCPSLEVNDGRPLVESNVAWVPKTTAILTDGKVSFGESCVETPEVDIIIYCSGYDYSFPFINDKSGLDLSVVSGERRVSPLYEQLWHAEYPSLAFVGLQHSVVPFPFFEVQAEAIVAQLLLNRQASKIVDGSIGPTTTTESPTPSPQVKIPALKQRMESAMKDAASGGPKNPGRVQDTHFLGSYQWEQCLKYQKYAAGHCDHNKFKQYIMTNKALYDHAGSQRKNEFPGGPDEYRYNSYIRDDKNESFEVHSLHHLMKDHRYKQQEGKEVSADAANV